MSDPTARTRLGRSRIEISRLGFGSAPLGGLLRETREDDALDAVRTALAQGLRYFDVAPQYGGGLAERRLGQALRDVPRDSYVLSTKVGKIVEDVPDGAAATTGFVGAAPHLITYDYSYDGVMRSFEASLDRLGLDRVDILLIHDVNRKYHGEQVMLRFEEAKAGACRALVKLRDEGVIAAFGPALNEVDVALRFVRETDVDCIMLPRRYTPLDSSSAAELLPLCKSKQVGVLVAAPFDSGILATGAVPSATYNYQPAAPEILARVKAIETLCDEFGVPLQAVALQYALQNDAVTSVVTGMRSGQEVSQNIASMRVPIPPDFWARLVSISVF
jgi:D-threo-aldose 1-dehydrogenase